MSLGGTTEVVDSPRVLAMIRWLLANQMRIHEIQKGQLAFSFAGPKALTAEIVDKRDLSQN